MQEPCKLARVCRWTENCGRLRSRSSFASLEQKYDVMGLMRLASFRLHLVVYQPLSVGSGTVGRAVRAYLCSRERARGWPASFRPRARARRPATFRPSRAVRLSDLQAFLLPTSFTWKSGLFEFSFGLKTNTFRLRRANIRT